MLVYNRFWGLVRDCTRLYEIVLDCTRFRSQLDQLQAIPPSFRGIIGILLTYQQIWSDFIATPTVEAFEAFKKPELLTLAQKLGLIHVKVSMRKPAIRREIAEYYYDEGVFTDDDLARFPLFVSENVSEFDLAKLKLEHEIKMKQLELE